MRRGDDRLLARSLANALDGRAQPTGELEALVRVLEAAAAEARFDVSQVETERALATARPGPVRRRRLLLPVAVATGVAVALAAGLLLLSPSGSPTLVNVQAGALAALGGPGSVLEVTERIMPGPAGGFTPSTRAGWIDAARGEARFTQRTADGTVVDETLVERSRITRYDPVTGTAVIAGSCAALATGCASAVDPLTVYRRALERVAATAATPVTFAGGPAYRFSLPVQALRDGVRIAQVVTVDARTLLPERIEWRERRQGGHVQTAAVIDIRDAGAVAREQAPDGAFLLTLPPKTVVTQLAAPGRPVRLLGTRRLTLSEARALSPPLYWLGPRAAGHPLGAITLYRYNAGVAVRLRYGPLLAWDYGPVVPPPLLGNRLVPVKQIVIGARSVRVYSTVGGQLAVERDRPGGTVALIGPIFTKPAYFEAIGHLRPLPRR
jgi:hypothetical protein